MGIRALVDRGSAGWWGLFILGLVALALPAHAAQKEAAFPPQPEFFEGLSYRFIGPIGNRAPAVIGVPGDPHTYYVGAASGGIFKTEDGGLTWHPIFDDQPVASIGALAVAPSDPNVVWAGTGETFIRSNVSLGNGIYRSTDGGESWKHMGLDRTGRIGRILIHPTNPDIVFAAALGHCYGPQPERGVYRTTDGGESWEKVLFVDENTGASDLAMHPGNPRVLYAGTWQMEMRTWGRTSGGPGSGLHVSRDGGDTWSRLEGRGLPAPPWGKIGLAVTPADPSLVYALIETSSNRDFAPLSGAESNGDEVDADGQHQGVLWRSDNAGRKWRRVSSDHTLVQRPLYYTRAAVSPDDPDEIRFMAVRHSLSIDGGKTITTVRSGGDHHDIWIDPENADRMILGHDQGISISTNRGKSWFRPQLPIAQMYHVATDDRVPYFVYGNRQDGSSFRGPSNTLSGGPIPIGAWHPVGGCESGFAIPEPGGEIVWSGCYDGILERYDVTTGHSRNVSVWPEAIESSPAEDLRYRVQWTFPVALSPHQSGRVYAGTQHVHETRDGGHSWREISPDLTTDAAHLQVRSGGLTPDDASPTLAPVVFAIAESPLSAGEIWAGTNDGQVQLTRDGGATWTNLTAALPGLPPWGTVSNIEPSRHAAGKAYLTVDRHQENDTRPHVYKTGDHGATWTKITGGIPESTHSYAHVIREDPERPGLLYLGTENALYVSFNDGGSWQSFQGNLPPAPVHWIDIPPHFGDLVVATYGRGFWIRDDLSPLREVTAEVLAEEAHLFAPRAAYRFANKPGIVQQPGDPAVGRNPRYGAYLHYYLGESFGAGEDEPQDEDEEAETEAEAENGGEEEHDGEEEHEKKGDEGREITLEILDGEGRVIRTLEDLPSSPGLHRVVWDLESESSKEPKLRTRPVEHEHEALPQEGEDRGKRGLAEGFAISHRVAPGTYTVRLQTGGPALAQTLEVRQDPSSKSSPDDIRQQNTFLASIIEHQDRVVTLIDDLEWMRKQLGDLEERLAAAEESDKDRRKLVQRDPETGAEPPPYQRVRKAARALRAELRELEGQLFDLRLTSAGQDFLRWPRKLYGRLSYLGGSVINADFPPTEAHRQLLAAVVSAVEAAEEEMKILQERSVARFNQLLQDQGIGVIGSVPGL